MKTCRLQARNASGGSVESRTIASAVRTAPSWLYHVGSPIGRRKELMIGDIQRPQRRTTIRFSPSCASPSFVKKLRIGVVSFWKYAVMKVRLIANNHAAVDQLIRPASDS